MKLLLKIPGDVLSRHIWVQPRAPAIWEGLSEMWQSSQQRNLLSNTSHGLLFSEQHQEPTTSKPV